jgi:hypothetical protein
MHMSYGEFCDLFRLDGHGPETFAFWLRSHLLPPLLEQRVIEKARREAGDLSLLWAEAES